MKSIDQPNFKLTDNIDNPSSLDYDIYGLHKKRTIVKGELILVEYYKEFDINTQTYTDLVLTEQRTYNRDENTGLVYSRTQYNEWYLSDDTSGCNKTTTKYYSLSEAIDEGISRRKNVIADAKIYALMNLGLVPAQTLLSQLTREINIYIDGAPIYLITTVNSLDTIPENVKVGLVDILTL